MNLIQLAQRIRLIILVGIFYLFVLNFTHIEP